MPLCLCRRLDGSLCPPQRHRQKHTRDPLDENVILTDGPHGKMLNITVREMHIKATVRYHLTPVRMTIKKSSNNKFSDDTKIKIVSHY